MTRMDLLFWSMYFYSVRYQLKMFKKKTFLDPSLNSVLHQLIGCILGCDPSLLFCNRSKKTWHWWLNVLDGGGISGCLQWVKSESFPVPLACTRLWQPSSCLFVSLWKTLARIFHRRPQDVTLCTFSSASSLPESDNVKKTHRGRLTDKMYFQSFLGREAQN